MSLVNKMLRDLDARRAGESDRAGLPAAVTSLAAHQKDERSLSRLWIALPLLVTGIAALAWYGMQLPGFEWPVVFWAPAGQSVPLVQVPEPAPVAAVVAPETPDAARPPATDATSADPVLRLADQLSTIPSVPVARSRPVVQAGPVALPSRVEANASKAAEASVVAPAASSRPPLVVFPRVPPVAGAVRIDKQAHLPSAAERAENEYRRGFQAQRQGHLDEAAGSFRAALADFAEHAAARQTLAALLIDAKRFDEAEELLRKGVDLAPVRLASVLALARLKVERNQAGAALELLLGSAAAGERSAEFQGFTGALLNRVGRAAEAVERYQAATRLAPNEGRWWAGLGIALDAAGKGAEAREAYQKARAAPGLPADLAQHIEQRLH